MEGARFAVPGDRSAIADIAEAHEASLAEQRGGPLFLRRESGARPAGDRAEDAIGDQAGRVVVGTFDDVVFGYAIGWIETLSDGGLLGRIHDLLVTPDAREVGVGAAMMDVLLAEFEDAGCLGVDSRALPGDRHTKNFFESYGLKARLLVVHRSFED